MRNFRNSKIAKFIAVFLAFSIFNLSCTSENYSTITNCQPILFDIEGEANIPDQFERALELAQTIKYNNNPVTYGDYHNELFGQGNEALNHITTFNAEAAKYSNMGFENYLSDIVSRSLMSNDLKLHFIQLSTSLNNFLYADRVDLEQFISFLNNQRTLSQNSNLCAGDKSTFSKYLDLAQGYGQFMFKQFPNNDNSLRDCNLLEAIGCGLLALVVGAVVFVVAGVIVLLATVTVHNPDGTTNTMTGKNKENFAAFAGFALGIIAGINVYKWCCGKDEVPEQQCKKPTGSVYTSLGCNDFRVTLFGPSSYGATEWSNTNTNPATATTPTPSLRFSVPNLSSPSIINAPMVACLSSGSSLEIFSYGPETQTFTYNSPTPTIIWGQSPPSTATVSTTYNVSVSTAGNGIVSWSVSPFGGMVMSTGAGSGNLIFWTSGQKTVTATITDNCTGQNASVSKQVFVQ